MKEECGVVGIILKHESNLILPMLYNSLYTLQHRGQDSFGFFVKNRNKSNDFFYKNIGLLSNFNLKSKFNVCGNIGVGHVRSGTIDTIDIKYSQPYFNQFKEFKIYISFNGCIVNKEKLINNINKNNIKLNSDPELIYYLLIEELKIHDINKSLINLFSSLDGGFGLVIMINELLYAIRDKHGIKPICFGKINNNGYIIASESSSIDIIEGSLIRDIYPGEIIEFNKDGNYKSFIYNNNSKIGHCIFEYIYIARPDSIINGKLVYSVREQIGRELAKEKKEYEFDIVSPIPDSGIIFAIGYSSESKIKYEECFVKNKYIGRTFILPIQRYREELINLKLNPIYKNINGKNIVLIDDSIVRGTTTKGIINSIKKKNPKSIHIRVASPPVIKPCYFGVDIKSEYDLIAFSKTDDLISNEIGATTVSYISIDGIIKGIGIDKNKLCLGCLSGIYPMDIK